jgi:tungstate transport system ATP-binding protein
MKEVLRIHDLKQSYNGQLVLDIPLFAVDEQEIVAIIGPSGAGKSTLLRLTNGLERPTQGKIFLRGDIVSPDEAGLPVRRRMATVFQKPAVFNASVADNVAYGLLVRGARKGEICDRVDAALDFVGLLSKKKQSARTLSGGEMQRVAMAMAIITQPDLFLLDEPTANLDPSNVAICEELIVSARAKFNMTIVLVTHNMFQAKRLATRTVLLLGGEIIEQGPTNDVFHHPKDSRTVEFVQGEMIY